MNAVIFDLDGVIVDSANYHKIAWKQAADQNNWKMEDEDFEKIFGLQNSLIIEILSGKKPTPQQVAEIGDLKEENYRQMVKGNLVLLDGVHDFLADLKNNNFALAVGTSAPKANLELMLSETKVKDFFSACVTSEDTDKGKPAPDTFLIAAKKLNAAPENCVVIEDAVKGVQAGKAAGMKVIAVTNTTDRKTLENYADLVVDSLAEIDSQSVNQLLNN